MPKRTDIRSILVIGSGPIVIGQGCEFDYSGAQALKSLKAEGYRVVLVNSNPATIMTDPALSDRTYIEPITPEAVRKIIEKEVTEGEGLDAVLPTLGGQTALNCACALWDDGTLEKYGLEMIGANREVIHRAEDRDRFSRICHEIGLKTPESKSVNTLQDARAFLEQVGLPAIIRPAFTLGGWGGGIAYNAEEFDELVQRGLGASMIHQVQVDRSLIGWKEYELEVVRDRKDNCVVVCGIENIDAMGVHTGDSITVAPILTLTDKEYQALRDAAFAVMRAVGVETGGSNVQFAVNPDPEPGPDGKKRFEFVVVEMNPRVSRSSALASKATGFPIAKIAAKLAVGYTLDELRNDVTGTTSACFEPTIDYVVTKMPRWTFEKFPEADETLTTQMKSVGEAMAIGRTFKESWQKVIRSMDVKRFGFGLDRNDKWLAAMRAVESEQLVLDLGGPTLRGGSGVGRRSAAGGSAGAKQAADLAEVASRLKADPLAGLNPADFTLRDPYPPGMYGPVRDLVRSRRDLPHLTLPDATYFVTWRVSEGEQLTPAERNIVMDALLHFDGDRCRVYAAAVMPDHVHWIVRPYDGHSLGELVRSVKHYSAVQVNNGRGVRGHLWQEEGFDHIIRDRASFNDTVRYVLDNPVDAQVATDAAAYPWTFVHVEVLGAAAEEGDPAAAERRPTQGAGTGLRTADGQPIEWPIPIDKLTRKLAAPSQGRPYYIRYALKMGWSIEHIHELTKIDPFFLDQLAQLVEFEDKLCSYSTLEDVPADVLLEAKKLGYADAQLANLYLGRISSETILEMRRHRKRLGIEPVYKLVDTCAAEFEAATPYFYSTYEGGVGGTSDGATERRSDEGGRHKGTEAQRHKEDGRSRDASPHPSVASSLRRFVASAEDEIRITDRPKVIILGGGPNRIGQGIEFDYCCVHAAFAARELGFESVMINSNPETVSTDYDTSDLLFFEPLTLEDVVNVVERLNGGALGEESDGATRRRSDEGGEGTDAQRHRGAKGEAAASAVAGSDPSVASSLRRSVASGHGLVHGCIVQFGGQTPLNLAHGLAKAGVPIIGTSLDSIDLAEDRDRFDHLLEQLDLKRPASGIARSLDQAVQVASRVGYPVLVRPSYVLGGRGMEICPDENALRHYINTALGVSDLDDAPVLIDQFLGAATEVDVDVVADFVPDGRHRGTEAPGHNGGESDGRRAVVCGVMEHIEHAGVHSGDSTCVIPPFSLRPSLVKRIKTISRQLAEALQVCGLMNVQLAVKDDEIYILEVNPRASRTAPFVGKAKHTPWPALAAKCMMGRTLAELGAEEIPDTGAYAVKAPVWPFQKFPGVDFVLGPEMKSTGEVMGIDASLPIAYAKALMGAGITLPIEGAVFLSVRDADKPAMVDVCRSLMAMGFTVYTTGGTADFLARYSVRPKRLQKIAAGARPNVLDLMKSGDIGLVINTPTRTGWQTDEGKMRAAAVRLSIPMLTTATAAMAVVRAIEALRAGDWDVKPLQEYAALAKEAVAAI